MSALLSSIRIDLGKGERIVDRQRRAVGSPLWHRQAWVRLCCCHVWHVSRLEAGQIENMQRRFVRSFVATNNKTRTSSAMLLGTRLCYASSLKGTTAVMRCQRATVCFTLLAGFLSTSEHDHPSTPCRLALQELMKLLACALDYGPFALASLFRSS